MPTALLINVFAEIVTRHYCAFITSEAESLGLVIDDEIARMIARGCPTIAGSSGGKDSDVLILLLDKLYKAVGYTGERVVIHADMGAIEHKESLGQVVALAKHVGWKYKIVRRAAGDLIQRYEQRWRDNVSRYTNLECVTLISPFPTKTALFCRSEVKVAPIMQAAVKMFPGQAIISAVGLRREESTDRSKSPVSKENPGLSRADGTSGRDWFPILNILVEQVWLIHRQEGFRWHIQYDRGNDRLSCAWCFMGKGDWIHGVRVESNHASYIRMSALEILTGFSYAPQDWLCDTDPTVLPVELREQIEAGKRRAERRRFIEKHIPKHLLFQNDGGRRGWPKTQPTMEECELLASVRREVGQLMNLQMHYTTGQAVYDRYTELLREKAERDRRKAKKTERASRNEGRVVKVKGAGEKKRRVRVTSNVQGVAPAQLVASQQPNYQASLF